MVKLQLSEGQAALMWLIMRHVSAVSALPKVQEDLTVIYQQLDSNKGAFEDVLGEELEAIVPSGTGIHFY